MGVLTTATHLEQVLSRIREVRGRVPAIFLELGTFEGRMAALARTFFPTVHTVELSPVYHAQAKARYADLGGIEFHLGDSRDVLPRLCQELTQPVVFYHDAHWWPHPDVAKSFPLWDDLRTMAARLWDDVIVVDEVHRFGDLLPTQNWQEVSLERIGKQFPGHRSAEIIGNMAVVVR